WDPSATPIRTRHSTISLGRLGGPTLVMTSGSRTRKGTCRRGEAGEIQVRGDFLMLGYLNQPEATRNTFTADGWLRTGDLASEEPDGQYRLIGRLREMFKSGGYNVYPKEIEAVLESHPAVNLAAVVAVPDPLYGEV